MSSLSSDREQIRDKQYYHDGVDKTPTSWQADDIVNLRDAYIYAILLSDSRVRSVRSEERVGVRTKDDKGFLSVTVNLLNKTWHDEVDNKSGGEVTLLGHKPRKRHVEYKLDVDIVQTVTRVGSSAPFDFEFVKLQDVAIRESVDDVGSTGSGHFPNEPLMQARPSSVR